MLSSSSRVSGWTSSSGTSSISGGSGSGSGSGSGAGGSKLGSAQVSKPPTSLARIRSEGSSSFLAMALDHFLAALAAEHDFARFGHATGNGEDFLLRGFHIADTHRALGLEIVAQQFGRTLGHVLEDLLLDAFVRALEGQHQHVGGHFAQQRLDTAIVDIGQVVEHEHE